MANLDARINGGMSAENMAKYFPVSAGEKDKLGVLKLPDAERGQPKKEQTKQPEKTLPNDAELAAEDERSSERRASSELSVLGQNLDGILDKIHSMQVAKVGGRKDDFSDEILAGMLRDFAKDLRIEKKKQNIDELLGKTVKLGEELSKLGPQMKKVWDNQVSFNRLDLPN